jgi:hypothetical protein
LIRLTKGRTVRGRVLDYLGKAVQDASVFAVRPTGMTLAGGRAVNSFDGEEDQTVRRAKTDSEGHFELAVSVAAGQRRAAGDPPAAAGATPRLAVSSPALDAWPVRVRPLPEDLPREHRAGTISGSTVRRSGQQKDDSHFVRPDDRQSPDRIS